MIEILNGIRETVDYHGDFKIRIYLNKNNENYPQHWHSDIEIIMPLENTYKAVINDTTYELQVEDILIIPPGELHQLYSPPAGQRIILQFDCSMFDNLNEFNSTFDMLRPCVTVTPAAMPDIHRQLASLLRSITSEYFSNLAYREASAYSMLIRFFTTLGRSCISGNETFLRIKNSKHHEYINLLFYVCNYINEHCTENIKIDDIASIAGFSKYHFERLFKKVMNLSCYDYITNRRIMNAEKLLTDPELSIMQVAMKSGFSSLATFNRVFKSKNNCTPSEYKIKCRSNTRLNS